MFFNFRKTVFYSSINLLLFLMMMIGIQNSSNKIKVNLLFNETIKLPVGFLIGTSFICGTILGSFIDIGDFSKKK